MNPESSYRWVCLAPRCRLITSWWCIICQGFGCSPIKVIRELGSERRETVWSLSTVLIENKHVFTLVREDREELTSGLAIVGKLTGCNATLEAITTENN